MLHVPRETGMVAMEGNPVFKIAVNTLDQIVDETLTANGLQKSDIDWLVPHQANLRIIDATAERMCLSKEKVMINIDHYGNTTNGTLPLCLWDWESKLKKGDNLVLAAFGGGFTWGAIYLKWAYDGSEVK
jgi:3-oxoacyl-[acyl-carrier-protein] synthase-3